MTTQKAFITPELVTKIAESFQSAPISYNTDFQTKGSSGKVSRLFLNLKNTKGYDLIIKPEIPEFEEFYNNVLLPYELNYPQVYSFITHNGIFYIIQEYIEHEYADWNSTEKYQVAIEWLIRKDKICQNNMKDIVKGKISYLGKTKFYGIEEWYDEIIKSAENNNCLLIDKTFINDLESHRKHFDKTLHSLENSMYATIIHGDLSLHNFLFTTTNKLYVIDWTQPRVGSFAIDLANIVDHAQNSMQEKLINSYKQSFAIKDFDEEYNRAVAIRNLSYFSWMALMFNEDEGSEINLDEMKRVKTNLANYLKL